jgi:hypothetical protein
MTKVRCSVDSCEFWGEGEVCKADSIWVKNDMIGDADDELPDDEFLGDFNTEITYDLGAFPEDEGDIEEFYSAGTSHHTCCETMRPRKRRTK